MASINHIFSPFCLYSGRSWKTWWIGREALLHVQRPYGYCGQEEQEGSRWWWLECAISTQYVAWSGKISQNLGDIYFVDTFKIGLRPILFLLFENVYITHNLLPSFDGAFIGLFQEKYNFPKTFIGYNHVEKIDMTVVWLILNNGVTCDVIRKINEKSKVFGFWKEPNFFFLQLVLSIIFNSCSNNYCPLIIEFSASCSTFMYNHWDNHNQIEYDDISSGLHANWFFLITSHNFPNSIITSIWQTDPHLSTKKAVFIYFNW